MRVISGSAKGIKLISPDNDKIRPTTDRYKEDIFNIINVDIIGSRFLDLFSGTGAIGIEALSRGAKFCYFNDEHSSAISIIQKNLKKTKIFEKYLILQYDYSKAINNLKNEQFDFIYLDPPFDKNLEISALKKIIEYDILSDSGTIICESSINTNLDSISEMGFKIVREKKYKYCKFTFLKKEL